MGDSILHNRVRCRTCGDVIESRHTHGFVTCSCGAVSVDGGHTNLRRVFAEEGCFEELSTFAVGGNDAEGPSREF